MLSKERDIEAAPELPHRKSHLNKGPGAGEGRGAGKEAAGSQHSSVMAWVLGPHGEQWLD